MLTNMDKLYESVAANGPVCVGLDTEISYLPTTDTAKTAGENVVAFNRALIDATKGVAGCYKVQIAYYESLGLDGMRAYAETPVPPPCWAWPTARACWSRATTPTSCWWTLTTCTRSTPTSCTARARTAPTTAHCCTEKW